MLERRKSALSADLERPVVVIATGGTIAQNGGRDAILGVDGLIEASGAEGPTESVQFLQKTSPNITIDDWVTLSHRVQGIAKRVDIAGIVITHGTDTLEETGFFLDLTCRTETPIVMVGAMRPASSPESDGEHNLRDGIALARSPAARGRGVLILLSGVIHSARDVTKRHSHSLDAFESPNAGALATWPLADGETIPVLPPIPFFEVPARIADVLIVYSYAGMSVDALRSIQLSRPAGIIWAGTGAGSIPDNVLPVLTSLAEKGSQIIRASRTGAGAVPRNGEVDDDAYGFIASSITPQKSRILAMLCLASGLTLRETQAAFDACSALSSV